MCLDPGHGGGNLGTVNGNPEDRLVEKDVTLSIALKVFDRLSGISGIMPVLTRTDDEPVSLTERGKISDDCCADLVLSIHVNATKGIYERGCMAFYWPGNRDGRDVANHIVACAPSELRRPREEGRAAVENLWPRVRNVLSKHEATAVLAECGFATNPHDRRFLLNDAGQEAMATSLVGGVLAFKLIQEAKKAHMP